MAQENGNSTMEMGTSDQVLVATKRKKTLTYVIGGVVMVAIIALVVTLSVVLTGGDDAVSEPIVSTTEGPSSPNITPTPSPSPSPAPTDPPTESTTDSTTDSTTEATTEPITPAPPPTLDLDAIIEGSYSPSSFNATWVADNAALFRDSYGNLVTYNVDTGYITQLVENSSEILQRSSRVATIAPDGNHVVLAHEVIPIYRYSFAAHYTVVDIVNNRYVSIVPEGVRAEQAFLQNFLWGPIGTSLAFVYQNNIYYQSNLNETPRQITTTGTSSKIYHGIPDWVYEEEVFSSNNAIWFSKDGNKLAFATFDDSLVHVMKVPHYGVPGSLDYQYTQHSEIRYPKSGTTNPTVKVTIYDLNTNTPTEYSGPVDLTYPILKSVTFVSNNQIAVMWTNRAQTTLRVLLCTDGTETCTTIYQYTEPNGWIDNIPLIFNDVGDSFITILPQAVGSSSFKQIVQVTRGTDEAILTWTSRNRINTAHTVIDIIHWSSSDVIWYKATSVDDSAAQHIYHVDPSGQVECFTCDIQANNEKYCAFNDGTINSDGSRIVINCAGPNVPQTFIYDTNGTQISVWDDSSALIESLADIVLPEIVYDNIEIPGVGHAQVLLQLPPDYRNETSAELPLLVFVYAGPDTALVTKQWNLDWGSYLVSNRRIAVAHIDGRGSGLRGVENMFAVHRKLGTLEIEDQIYITKQLQNHPFIDKDRTCIWGWSYGGYAATKALAEGGDVFRCAAAVAPVVDWRFYDTIYTERYMDVPTANVEGYAASSLLNNNVAEALRYKSYFLIHGTADDNVHYQHAMLLSRLLQRNDVYFTQMSYTDEDHGLVEVRPHLYHALEKFLVENMF